MKSVMELQSAKAAALKKVVLRKGQAVLDKNVTSDYKYTVLVCGGTGCTSSHSPDIVAKLKSEIAAAGIEKDVQTVGVKATLIVSADTDEETEEE